MGDKCYFSHEGFVPGSGPIKDESFRGESGSRGSRGGIGMPPSFRGRGGLTSPAGMFHEDHLSMSMPDLTPSFRGSYRGGRGMRRREYPSRRYDDDDEMINLNFKSDD